MTSEYFKIGWRESYNQTRTPRSKLLFYRLVRPLLSAYTRRWLSPKTVAAFRPSLVLPGRGLPVEDRRRWAARRCRIGEATVLVQGTGTGWDVITWAQLKPRRIIATDLFAFPESWGEIAQFCNEQLGVPVELREAPLEDHSFLADGSIDLCVSDAVYEHCRDLPSVIAESYRVLRPGGSLYAGYGPMWFSSGGDHFSGRGGDEHIFNHVLLTDDEYRAYFERHRTESEDFQSGGRYVELDLFSKLTTLEYLDAFRQAGFRIDELILEVSPAGHAYRGRFPDRFQRLCERYAGRCDPDDFLINANLVRLIRPVS